MKKITLFLVFSLLHCSLFVSSSFAEPTKPEKVKAGIYVTSIHDIDFKQNEFTINLWLWLKYKNRDFDFVQNLEIPQAKTFNKLLGLGRINAKGF